MTLQETALDEALEALLEQALAIPACRDEHRRARISFADGRAPAASLDRRADEWFLLERHSQALGGVPIELALHGGLALHGELALGEGHREALAALLGSQNGIFEVSGVEAGQGVWVRDLLTGGEYALDEPLGSRSLENGDLLAGRLFPVGDGLHRVSRAAGVFRSAPLREALRRDLERARSMRRGLLRLAGPELERMLFEPSSAEEGARCLAEARQVLAGLPEPEVEAIFERLRREPFDGRVLPGASDVLGDVLSELAFDTSVDLEAARAALLALWPHLGNEGGNSGSGEPEAVNGVGDAAPRRPSPREAMAAFDRGRREGRDLEELFRELERDLELDPDPAEVGDEAREPADDERAPDFPGVVGAVVEEYLWELGRERGAEAQRERALLGRLSTFAAPIGLFEELDGPALSLFAAVWLPERGELSGADEARALLAALRDFCAWVETAHEVPLAAAYAEHVAPLEEALPRIAEANRLLARAPHAADRAADRAAWFAITAVAPGHLALEDERGMPATCPVSSALASRLAPGDAVRAAPVDGDGGDAGGGAAAGGGGLALVCVYPARARDLAQGAPAEA
jgi:hypothetical protein